ncbi:hypothetical protein TCAL_16200 [Tigriopus californicus]|uniref:PKD/Chitinase domain-containing protein n=1 Tax=Tigriopus californicus TaxID=6832 RepID=A0A553P1X1_TIGCA|nr:hypothetical protein TCAL_16200 [Tigriopus californicus]
MFASLSARGNCCCPIIFKYLCFTAKRTNKPPTVVLQPSTQQINLPTSKAIIDASASVDDATPKDQLVFKWELKSEPLGYSKDLKETGPTLTLDDLIAGNYIIQVTVTDGDGAKSVVAEATIDVVPETDYPPTANAGEDIILYLPQREVTDAKGQFSQDEVNVYVKAPTNLPPTANAGPDQEISLPKTWVILDGSASKDDVQVTKYNWTQISGPNQASFMTNNTGSANATGLTRGVYVFQLEVSDERNNTDQAQVTVTVNQDANSAPVADAGEDFAVTLPVNSVYLNGSLSKDDLKVTKWLWTRAPNSLAAGKIVGNTDVQPALLIADLVPGQYTFELQVWDEQGKSSSDSVTLTVKENPEKKNVVQAVFNADIASLTQTQLSNLIQGWVYYCIAVGNYAVIHFIVVRSTTSINPVGSSPSASSSSSSALDLALDDAAVASGKKVVKELKSKLKADSGLLSFKFLSLDTLICQNECSGHGKCHQATRTCVCEPFWVENFVRTKLFIAGE